MRRRVHIYFLIPGPFETNLQCLRKKIVNGSPHNWQYCYQEIKSKKHEFFQYEIEGILIMKFFSKSLVKIALLKP